MALNIDVTFEGKLICAFKNDMRSLANIYQSIFESLKIKNKENNYLFSSFTKNDVNLVKIIFRLYIPKFNDFWNVKSKY